jgi:chromosome condensin MukBEF complex kleisin-like MukF subunit
MHMGKKLEGVAKKNVEAALRLRHNHPELAARKLREVLGHVPEAVVWDSVRKVNPQAVHELQTVLRTTQIKRAG